MQRLLWIVGAVIGSSIGWWAGQKVGIMTAFALSSVGMAAGVYLGIKLSQKLLE